MAARREKTGSKIYDNLPVILMRDTVIFPNMNIPLLIGQRKSIKAVDRSYAENKPVFMMTYRDSTNDEFDSENLYHVGTICHISQIIRLNDGTIKILISGKERGLASKVVDEGEYISACVEVQSEIPVKNLKNAEAQRLVLLGEIEQLSKASKRIPIETYEVLFAIEDLSKLADHTASFLPFKISERQTILETKSVEKRLRILIELLEAQNELAQIEKRIKTRVKKQVEKNQKEYYLTEQLKAIHRELGDGPEQTNEFKELETQIKDKHLPKEAAEKVFAELKRLKNIPALSQEGGIIRNYIDWLLNIPWTTQTAETTLLEAEASLNESHYGLTKVKERIMEYLAVQQRVKKMKAQIMCFVGPPGVGKTSLGKAIAKATNKNFVRIALGGVNDEAEIRGHRRTYIGAMPGKIIQAMKKAGTTDPVLMLDEIDKLGNDWRGDPTSALLEVLDPEQNEAFVDHYLEVPYDLSNVMFLTTANSLDIPSPLLDRMEVIYLSGYTEEEKLNIAKIHIIPKQKEENGLKDDELEFSDEALLKIIRDYTRESGVRNLERSIAKVCRKAVKKILTNDDVIKISITKDNLDEFLGIPKYSFLKLEEENKVGVVTGLAWTEMGGDLLSVESLVLPGSGNILSTGKLGEVMQESIKAAYSYVKSQSAHFKLKEEVFSKHDVHVHVPEGAVPKDGPSAGVTVCTAIVSSLTKKKVRNDIAMTGEITLRGKILPIGGLKEKLLAANRGAIKTVFIPKENEKDLVELPKNLIDSLEIRCVEHISEILASVLVS